MTCIKLTHANHNNSVYIAVPLFFCAYYSTGHKCTHVMATGGAIVPVSESPDEVMKLVENAQGGVAAPPITQS
jgi:hypothetical protein